MEHTDYLSKQLITCLGNKRALLGFIGAALGEVKTRLGRGELRCADLFAGSGIVSRLFKQEGAAYILSNDLERYAQTIARCYLANPDETALREVYDALLRDIEANPVEDGFLRRLYAPADERDIRPGERVFYTPRNAAYLDACRQAIGRLDEEVQPYFIAPLLSEASVKCNTSGVFKGFYKDRRTGLGAYGGTGGNALQRILAPIMLPFPLFCPRRCAFDAVSMDANELARRMEPVDLAYLDPPYNQHPYGSNYFMLNLINDYREPMELSAVSGIPRGWNRSAYNCAADAADTLQELCETVPARFLLISFNSEGFISRDEMARRLSPLGALTVFDTSYNVFRGSRNLRARPIHNREYLYLIERKGNE